MQRKASVDCQSVRLEVETGPRLLPGRGSLLGQQGVPVGLHLLQPFGQVIVTRLQLLDPVQSRAELQGDGRTVGLHPEEGKLKATSLLTFLRKTKTLNKQHRDK